MTKAIALSIQFTSNTFKYVPPRIGGRGGQSTIAIQLILPILQEVERAK